MSFNDAVKDFGQAHDKVIRLGEDALGIKYIDLVAVAGLVGPANQEAYLAAYHANVALRKAAYVVGLHLSPTKPPRIGPSIVIA